MKKDCGRHVPVNVSLNYSEEDDIYKLINEFSLTPNVLNNILEFILFYNYQLENHEFTHALILGERGTGKSYFLKILSLLLNNNIRINNETLLNYVKK